MPPLGYSDPASLDLGDGRKGGVFRSRGRPHKPGARDKQGKVSAGRRNAACRA